MRDHRQQQEDQHTKRQKTLVAILPFAARGCQTLMVCCCFLCVSLYVIVVVVVVVNVVVCSCLFLFSIFAHETVLLTYQVSYIYIYIPGTCPSAISAASRTPRVPSVCTCCLFFSPIRQECTAVGARFSTATVAWIFHICFQLK